MGASWVSLFHNGCGEFKCFQDHGQLRRSHGALPNRVMDRRIFLAVDFLTVAPPLHS